MSRNKQNLSKVLWEAIDKLQGETDAWSFKDYVFAILFYRFLSVNLINHVKSKYNIKYEDLSDEESEKFKNEIVNDKDFFIRPSNLFQNIIKTRLDDEFLDVILDVVFKEIVLTSPHKLQDIFKIINTQSKLLGETNKARSEKLSGLLEAVNKLKYNSIEETEFDTFGYTYEFLLNMYNKNFSRKDGIYYTPNSLGSLAVSLVNNYIDNPRNVYDPTCGSGSLLLEYAKYNNKAEFFGQELSINSYGLCKMNMILHNIDNYHITNADTLLTYNKNENEKYDLVLSNHHLV